MRLEQLQAFLSVAKTGNFQQAAHECGVTQSTVSRQIQGLEADLGIPLFHRSSIAKLTVGGEVLLPHARRICQEWQTAQQEISELLAGKQQELCVAAIPSLCSYGLPLVLQRFCWSHPEVQLRVTALGSDRALKVLKDGLVDLALIMQNRFLTQSAELVVDPLFEETIAVLMAADHALAEETLLSWEVISHYPQVVFKDGYGMQRLVHEQFSKHNLQYRAVLELNTLDAFRGVIRQGEFLAVLPESVVRLACEDSRVISRPLEPSIQDGGKTLSRQVVLVTTRDRLSIPPIENFRALALEYIPPQFTRQAAIATGIGNRK
jgi:DNA-binding transcriptional LysR family regulator